jgi:hypothetical protein
MAKKVNVDEIDERLIVAAVRKEQTKQEINPPPLVPLPAVVPAVSLSETVSVSDVAETAISEIQAQPETPPELPKEDNKRKRKQHDYEALFIRESNITARLGKTVYIRKEFHDRILKIVQVIGANEVSLFSYIDNIIAHHFDSFQDDIVRSYNSKNNSIF